MTQTPFHLIQNEKMVALFVNSSTPPDREVPQDVYEYATDGDETRFFRLYLCEYIQEDQIAHRVLRWYPVTVKPYAVAGMKQTIDAMKAAKAFLT